MKNQDESKLLASAPTSEQVEGLEGVDMDRANRAAATRVASSYAWFVGRFAAAVLLVAAAMLAAGVVFPSKARAQADPPPPAPSSVIVKLVPGLTIDEQATVIARNGGIETSTVPALRLHVVEVGADQIDQALAKYQSDSQVARVEVNAVRQSNTVPNDPMYPQQWPLPKIGWDQAFGTTNPSSNVVVAVLDTGIDASHPDLFGNVIAGTSILDESNGMTDPSGHGTMVSGTIAARTNTTTAEGIAGVAFAGVRLMPVTVLNADGLGQDSDIINGVIWAVDHGADVIVMAFSNPGFSASLQEAIDYAWSSNVVLVAANGNDGVNAPTFPAGDRGVIGVSATDENDQRAPFSNYGASVFLAAPGTDIVTTDLGGSYISINGTSSSAAIVAGAAAQMMAVDPTLSNGQIVGRLARTADPAGTQEETGNGRVNLARALLDTGIDFIQPAGAAPVGTGGPFLGPYRAASTQLTSISVGAQAGALVRGTAGTATFAVTVTGTGNGNLTNITVTAGLPIGAVFSPTKFPASGNCNASQSGCNFTLAITTAGTTPAGTFTFTLSVKSDGGDTRTAQGTLTIGKADQTIAFGALQSKSFGDPDFTVSATASSGLSVSFSASGNCTIAIATVHITGAGSCTITATQAGDSNYNAAQSVSQSFAIAKASSQVTVTVANATYDGNPHGATAIATGPGGLSQALAITYSGISGTTYPAQATPPTNAGDYRADASYAGDANYAAASGFSNYRISKAPATLTFSNLTQTYDGTAKQVTVTTTPSGLSGVSVTYNGAATAPVNAGSYAVVASLANQNYAASDATGTLVVKQAPLTITASDRTKAYGDEITFVGTEFSASGLFSPDTVTSVTLASAGAAAAAPVDGSPYPITATAAAGSGLANYVIAYVDGKLTVGKYLFNVCDTNGDCALGSDPNDLGIGGRLTIDASIPFKGGATAAVTLAPASRGGLDALVSPGQDANGHPLPPQFQVWIAPATDPTHPISFGTGTATKNAPPDDVDEWTTGVTASLDASIVPGDYIAYVYGFDGATITTNPALENGGYSKGDTANFKFPTLTAPFTVVKADQTITFAALADKTYGDADFAVSASASSGLAVTFAASGACTVSGTTVHISTAGTCTITASQAGDTNYNAAPDVKQSFTIKARSLTITAKDRTKTFGETITFVGDEFSVDGLVNGDTVKSVTLASAGAAATASVAGSPYPILPSAAVFVSGSATNYAIGYVNGILTVNKATATISVVPYDVTYDALAHTATGTAKGVGGADLGTSLNLAGTTHTNAGDYNGDVWTFSDPSGNYNDATGTVNDKIRKANATIAVTPYHGTYDGNAHTASGTATGVKGETLAGLDLTGTTHTNAADYPNDAWTFTDSTGNYNSTSGTAHDQIDKANATINVTPYHVTYDGNAHTATGSATGVKSEALSGLVLAGTTHTIAGDYPNDGWTFTDSTGNYNETSGTAHDQIDKATATINVSAYHITYDGNAHTATGTATGVNGESLAGLALAGTMHTAAGDYPSDPWTFTDVTGNYNNAAGTVHDSVTKANATINVAAYSVIYDGNPHTATGTATGVKSEALAGLALAGTTHTNVGNYADTWTFTDSTGNYNSTSGTANDSIAKANATINVTPYRVTYDGNAHIATGSAVGVKGESLAGLNLAGTAHTNAADYATDVWTFTDVSGNYNNASGPAHDIVDRAPSVVNVTGGAFTYDAVPHPASAIVWGVGAGITQTVIWTYSPPGDATIPINAGAYLASAAYAGDVNHLPNTGSASITIVPAPSMTTVSLVNAFFDNGPHGGTASVTGVGGLNQALAVTYAGTSGTTYGPSTTPPSSIGVYQASASYAGDANHVASGDIKSFNIVGINITGPGGPIAKGNPASVTMTLAGAGSSYPVTCKIDWNDGTSDTVSGSGTCTATHTYAAAGVYEPTVTVTSAALVGSASGTFQYIVIYDAGAGFVTGGGWINSPAGASTQYPDAIGKANFGFNSKYQKGADVPSGDTQFQFQAGNLNFKSKVYQWLVISGARAQYKGSGTINGVGDYGFILTAIDGSMNGGGGTDRFRIKIWDNNNNGAIVYDNQISTDDTATLTSPSTALGGGSIVIHK